MFCFNRAMLILCRAGDRRVHGVSAERHWRIHRHSWWTVSPTLTYAWPHMFTEGPYVSMWMKSFVYRHLQMETDERARQISVCPPGVMFPSPPVRAAWSWWILITILQSHLTWEWMLTKDKSQMLVFFFFFFWTVKWALDEKNDTTLIPDH